MVESRAREDDAFERAAAQLRPDWTSSEGGPASDEAGPASPVAAAGVAAPPRPLLDAEPSVIVQPDLALLVGAPGAAIGSSQVETERPPNPHGVMPSGFGVPSAFSRTEATVVTKPLPLGALSALAGGFRASSAQPLDGDELALAATERSRKLRLLAIGAAACVALGVVIALFSGSNPAPVSAPPPSAVVAPVVQPLPAVVAVPPTPAPGSKTSASKPSAAAASARDANAREGVAPAAKHEPPAARAPAKKPVARQFPAKPSKPVVAARPALAKPAAAKAPAQPTLAKGKGVAGKGVAGKAGAKAKPQPAAAKRARSPIDVLNPWAN